LKRKIGDNKARLYCTTHTEVNWAKHFQDSGLFVDFLKHFGGVPEEAKAGAAQ